MGEDHNILYLIFTGQLFLGLHYVRDTDLKKTCFICVYLMFFNISFFIRFKNAGSFLRHNINLNLHILVFC